MAQVDRIFELLSIFQTNSYALTTEKIAQRLECSIPTVKRYVAKLRNIYGIPLRYDFQYQAFLQHLRDSFCSIPFATY